MIFIFLLPSANVNGLTLIILFPIPPWDFRYVYTRRQKVPASEPVLVDSSSPVEGPSPQPSAPPYDLNIPIALYKGKSCIDHLIFYFVSYDHLNPSFRQFAMFVFYIYTQVM